MALTQKRNAHHPYKPFVFFAAVLLLSAPLYTLNFLHIPVPLDLPPSAIMIIVPMLVAGVLVYRRSGVRGWRNLVVPFFGKPRQESARGWFLLSLLIMPALMFVMHLVAKMTGLSAMDTSQIGITASLIALLIYFLGAIPEEIGWTKYATEPLQKRYGIFFAGLIIGVVWELWHFIPFLQQGYDIVNWIIPHMIAAVGVRIIMGYVFVNTKRALFPALAIHALNNFMPEILPGGYDSYNPIIFMTLAWIAVAIVWCLFTRKKNVQA